MNYKINKFTERLEWLKHRQIGSTDLVKIVNGKGRWETLNDLYNQLISPTYEERDNEKMSNGRKAEEHIKELFLLQHKELTRLNPPNELWLIQRTDYPEITLSPDTLVEKEDNTQGFIEIKYKEIFNETKIADYFYNLKETDPDYYWQLIHYFIGKTDLQFGYLVVAFVIKKKDTNNKWLYDRTIIDSLELTRKDVIEDIELGESKTIDFIVNNVRTKTPPNTTLRKEDLDLWQSMI